MEMARGVKARAMAMVPAGPARRAMATGRVPMVLHAKALGLTVRGAKAKAPARVVHKERCIAASSTSSRLPRISMRPVCPTRLPPYGPRLAAWLKNRAWAPATVPVRTVLHAKATVPVLMDLLAKVTVLVLMDLHAKATVLVLMVRRVKAGLVPMGLAKVALARPTNCGR